MKKYIAVLGGGYSGEAEISLKSADMVFNHIDTAKYAPFLVVIERDNWWVKTEDGNLPIDLQDFSFKLGGDKIRPELCVIMVHGAPGEDGKLQGYFDMIGMPYTTGGVMNMSLTFNKWFTNDLLRERGFNTAKSALLVSEEPFNGESLLERLKLPLFVKPNQGGSSIGISKVSEANELGAAIEQAFKVADEVLVEEFLDGREFTCGVLCDGDNFEPLAITEIATEREFFDYHAKYTHDQTREITPAELPQKLYLKCQNTSVEAARSFQCRGVIRIDYKLVGNDFFIIEINTVPGMTEHSIVPQQAEACGIGKKELVEKIVNSGLS